MRLISIDYLVSRALSQDIPRTIIESHLNEFCNKGYIYRLYDNHFLLIDRLNAYCIEDPVNIQRSFNLTVHIGRPRFRMLSDYFSSMKGSIKRMILPPHFKMTSKSKKLMWFVGSPHRLMDMIRVLFNDESLHDDIYFRTVTEHYNIYN